MSGPGRSIDDDVRSGLSNGSSVIASALSPRAARAKWRAHWEKTGRVRVDHADAIEEGWQIWLRFSEAKEPRVEGWHRETAAKEIAMLRADQGKYFGFTRVVATRSWA